MVSVISHAGANEVQEHLSLCRQIQLNQQFPQRTGGFNIFSKFANSNNLLPPKVIYSKLELNVINSRACHDL
jgi:hypothetical protein